MNEATAIVDYAHLINWFFYSMLTLIGGGLLKAAHLLVTNIIQLNAQIASIIEKIVFHEKMLEEHAGRIQYLERSK